MRNTSRNLLRGLIIAALLACVVGGWFLVRWTSDPKLSVAYLRTVDGKGHWRLSFGITNVGKSDVITTRIGTIEVFNQTNVMWVGVTAPLSRLAPGQGHAVEAVMSEQQMQMIDGKWRFTCAYAPDGMRTRIYQWQWGPGGRGASVNWLVPQRLKGMPSTVQHSSDWIEPVK